MSMPWMPRVCAAERLSGLPAVVSSSMHPALPVGPLSQVGTILLGHIAHIEWDDIGVAVPSFLTMVLMPFTYSGAGGWCACETGSIDGVVESAKAGTRWSRPTLKQTVHLISFRCAPHPSTPCSPARAQWHTA